MKRYIYMNDVPVVYGAKWMIARLVVVGVLLGSLTMAGFIWLNYSAGSIGSFRAAESMVQENGILEQQIHLMIPRVKALDFHVAQLRHINDTLYETFRSTKYFDRSSSIQKMDERLFIGSSDFVSQTASMKRSNRY